jgi:AcrR family transcriptional regulator
VPAPIGHAQPVYSYSTSLDDVATDLGVTKPTIYYYVSNKEQLLFECFRAVVHGYAEAIASEYGWCMLRAHEHDLGPELGRQINALKSEIDQGIRRLLREGMADGSIAACDPRITAFAIAGALNGIAHWYREDQPMTPAQVADAFAAFFANGLLPRPARHPPGRY